MSIDAEDIAHQVRDLQLEQMANGQTPPPASNPARDGEAAAKHVITFTWPTGKSVELVMGNLSGMTAMEVRVQTERLFGMAVTITDLMVQSGESVPGLEALCVLIFAARRQAGEEVTLEQVLNETTIDSLPEVEVEDGTEEPSVPLDRAQSDTGPPSGV